MTEGEVEEMLESGNPAVFTQGVRSCRMKKNISLNRFSVQIMVETAQAKQSLADIEARHGDIIKLEKSIKELHDMFIDMAALVQTQVRIFIPNANDRYRLMLKMIFREK